MLASNTQIIHLLNTYYVYIALYSFDKALIYASFNLYIYSV